MGRRPCGRQACAHITERYDITNYEYHIMPEQYQAHASEFRCQFPANADLMPRIPLPDGSTDCAQATDILWLFSDGEAILGVGCEFFPADREFRGGPSSPDFASNCDTAGTSAGLINPERTGTVTAATAADGRSQNA
jgi:hypothetical protein